MWGIVSVHAPGGAIYEQLIGGKYSIDSLSPSNSDGWGTGWFAGGDTSCTIERSAQMALIDPRYDTVVAAMMAAAPRIAVGHIRNCSSGLCDIPNPHPFHREKGGKHWLMAHNGTINKGGLLGLIRPEYLAANPPQYGVNESEWIDTDLYLIFVLQTLEDHGWEVKPALGEVVERLREVAWPIPLLNFVLTDGTTLWAYCEGNWLFYTYRAGDSAYSAVMSQPPTPTPGDWVMLWDGDLVTLTQDGAPVVEDIEAYFEPMGVADGEASLPGGIELGQNYPNPFNMSTSIRYEVRSRMAVKLAVYDVLGRRVATLVDEVKGAGSYVARWDGVGDDGGAVASGVYMCRMEGAGEFSVRKMVVVK